MYIPTSLPGFTYTGKYSTELRADWGWVIRFKTSGTLTITDRNRKIDIFLVGGGGGGAQNWYSSDALQGGGGGGYRLINGKYTSRPGKNGTANTGGGGGGAGPQGNDTDGEHPGGKGGSGIVCIRNSADDVLPVIFNGTQLTQLIYNGTTIQHLIYNGQQLY